MVLHRTLADRSDHQAHLDDRSLAVDAPDDGATLTLTATVTDPAGNTASATDSVTVDTTAPSVSLVITEDANDDGLLCRLTARPDAEAA